MNRRTQLTDTLFVHHGDINVGILQDGSRALLIDFGEGSVLSTLHDLGIKHIDTVLFTHYHRDQASGAPQALGLDTHIGVPHAERRWFESIAEFWNDPAYRWHVYDFHPDALMLTEPLGVDLALQEGDTLRWGDATLTAIATPGHTDGSLTYVVDVDDAGRFGFSGDVIYGAGQVWDIYSMQKGTGTPDYHGFLGARAELEHSLTRLERLELDGLVPSHGAMMRDPGAAIRLTRERIADSYTAYAATSALRYYFPALFAEFDSRQDFLPRQPTFAYPPFLRHIGTTWLILSAEGAAFALDCGSEQVVSELVALQRSRAIGTVEGLWITHYHDDHVDGVPAFNAQFGCPIYADAHVAMVVESPQAWRLPCLSPIEIQIDHITAHGERWRWHEFTFTAYHLPGQTLYHGGLLAEGRGKRIFFAGDSFTPTGIDDYCALNRNYLGAGVGFDACLALLETIKPDIILNAHVDEAFNFDAAALAFMRDNLRERERRFGDLLPWPHPNHGIDPSWIRCHPYEQIAAAGSSIELRIVITNHASAPCTVEARPVLPHQWGRTMSAAQVEIAPQTEAILPFHLDIPPDTDSGQWVIPIELAYNGIPLGYFREALLYVA